MAETDRPVAIFCGERFCPCRVKIGEHEPCAKRVHQASMGAALPPGSAGDEGDLAFERDDRFVSMR
ncbi:hypothetical protein GCM10027056_03700 [Glaciibacter psychrotolerans]